MGGSGQSNPNAELSAHSVWAIKKRYAERVLQGVETKKAIRKSLARQYRVSFKIVECITIGTTWRKPESGKSWEEWAKEQGL